MAADPHPDDQDPALVDTTFGPKADRILPRAAIWAVVALAVIVATMWWFTAQT